MENKETHIDVNQIRLLIQERKDKIKEKFKAEVVGIFGSYARGEEKEGNDIDVLVRFGERATLLHLTGLGFYLEDLFGVSVDVVSERALHPMMKDDVLRELVPVKGTCAGMRFYCFIFSLRRKRYMCYNFFMSQ
ncbi:Nucleotidyltransferase [Methanosarcina horonobensis HB-1 = JCM 15518]|uniref:protein adenylyltransferase n=1 Tax=Methanosarcina horonobensis HB-1 = JCM 15518 TaxID=1434110 RepID=A0A0E3SAH9_9EURY|nr:nucleotidyltransferase family protein [Methanosarcina horonobensis]AKB77811.1 Nucleotidyltransferase [Methanosarcina horonobensis HB-1 = JCM 15518]